MAVLTPQTLSLSGVAPTYNAANSGGDSFPNNGKTYAHIKNAGGSSITVTFHAVAASVSDTTFGDIAVSDTAVTVGANSEKIVGNFPLARFNNPSGQVDVSYSSATSVSIAVVNEGKSFV